MFIFDQLSESHNGRIAELRIFGSEYAKQAYEFRLKQRKDYEAMFPSVGVNSINDGIAIVARVIQDDDLTYTTIARSGFTGDSLVFANECTGDVRSNLLSVLTLLKEDVFQNSFFTCGTEEEYQGNSGVIQREVTVEPPDQFDGLNPTTLINAINLRIDSCHISRHYDVDFFGAGYIYMQRAVRQSSGKWKACIRCGVTGYLLYDGHVEHLTSDEALEEANSHMKQSVVQSLTDCMSSL